MLKRYRSIVWLFALMFFFVGCSQLAGEDAKSWSDMTSKEKSIFLMDMYSKQYDSYLTLYKKAEKTEAEKTLLKQKYEWINKVYPYIDAYATYADNGVVPPQETETLILELINQALGL